MELVPAAVPLSFEVTFDAVGLPVAMVVYDTSGSSPVVVGDPLPMALVYGFTYSAKFTPENGKTYVINKSVYTDETYTTLSDEYSQGSESIRAQYFAGPSSGNSVIGYIDQNTTVIGQIDC